MIIDSQVHIYEAHTPERPWLEPMEAWTSSMGGVGMVAAMDGAGVDGAIFVQSSRAYGYDDTHTRAVQQAYPGRLAIVKPIDLDDPAGPEIVQAWKRVPGAVGVRLRMIREQGPIPADDPRVDRFLAAAARCDMPVNFLCWGNLDVGTKVVDRHPDVRFVIDHLGMLQPEQPPVPQDVWADLPKVLELARRPNAVIKVTGACTMSMLKYPFADIWDPLQRIFDAWGLDRCLWGTDWTRATGLVTFREAVDAFRLSDRLSDSDRAMLMGVSTARAYGWRPR
jgi:predicted TIM-barrel fold metal-dependent hydrolase